MLEPIGGLALHLWAELWKRGQGQRGGAYWNHRNAAPVGSITFLEKKRERDREEKKTQDRSCVSLSVQL